MNRQDWIKLHEQAIKRPRGPEVGILALVRGAEAYCAVHLATHGSLIGEDGFGAPYMEDVLQACLGLLNFELGRLDGGTMDAWIRRIAADNGLEVD